MRNSAKLQMCGWLRDVTIVIAIVTATGLAQQTFGQTETVAVLGREYQEAVDLQGATVHGFQVTEISAKLGGYVKSFGKVNDLEVDVGSHVKKGDVLVELDIPEMKNDLAEKTAIVAQSKSAVIQADAAITEANAVVIQAKAALEQVRAGIAQKEAQLKLSKTKLGRLSKLAASGSIGQESLDEAQYEVEVANASLQSVQADIRAAEANIKASEASVAKAKADKDSAVAKVRVAESAVGRLEVLMGYTTIRAPYDGVITKRMIDLGSYVQPAEDNSAAMPVFELTQVNKVRIMVAVPNNKVSRIAVGQAVVFESIGGLEGRSFAGKITRTAGALDLKTRTLQIEVHMNNPATDTLSEEKVELRPGLYGTMVIIQKLWSKDNLLPYVPTTAVGKDKDGNNFVVVIENGKPTRRKVGIAFNDADSIGISSGLKVGEVVVKSGVSKY